MFEPSRSDCHAWASHPLFSTPAHLADWVATVRTDAERTGVRVVNCYLGYGTYATLGLAHHHAGVRHHLSHSWMMAMMRTAGALNVGLGFFAHAFSEKVLRDKTLYDRSYRNLVDTIRRLAAAAPATGVKTFGVEQMYTPHQVPWTLGCTADFLRRTNAGNPGLPAYITLDTGHQSGQRKFLVPQAADLERMITAVRADKPCDTYLGPREHYARFMDMVKKGTTAADLAAAVATHARENPHLFARPEDGDTYAWLGRYAAYSPIIHLQQTDGTVSAHRNFIPALESWGIIKALAVLRAIAQSFEGPVPEGFPPRVTELYLTLEPFLGTAAHARRELEEIAQSVAYWRQARACNRTSISSIFP
ncbi:MAG: hypothetical protein ABIF71_09595 [Planctomycetota bacterium]